MSDIEQEAADLRAEVERLTDQLADAHHALLEQVKAAAAAAALLSSSVPDSADGA